MEGLATSEQTGQLDLSLGPRLGPVVGIDLSRVEVEIPDRGLSARVTVSDLVAVPVAAGFLIGLIERMLGPPLTQADGAAAETEAEAFARLRVILLGTLHPPQGDSASTFTRGASAYPRLGESCYLIERERLRSFMAIVADAARPEERLVLGHYVADPEVAAIADGNRLFQRHAAMLGSTGAGKTWAAALILERAARLGEANVIVFDLHGEYAPLTQAMNGREPVARRLRMAGPRDIGQSGDELLYLPYWLLERDELLALVLNPDDPGASDQILRFTEHVQMLKGVYLVDAGKEETVRASTVDAPIPYVLEHLVAQLKRDNEEKIPRHPANVVEPGPYFGRLTGLISRIQARANDPRYGFMFSPPVHVQSYEWLNDAASKLLATGGAGAGIKIVDLSEVPRAVLPMVVGVLARLVYDVQFWMEPEARTPVCLVCDEAHQYLPADGRLGTVDTAALQAFEEIAKEGRKYGVALLLVSQRPSDVNRSILSQCNNFIVMRLADDHDRAMVERLVPEALTGITGMVPALEVGQATVIGDAVLLPTRFKFDLPTAKPASATQPYWSLWSSKPSSGRGIAASVEAFRNQLRSWPGRSGAGVR